MNIFYVDKSPVIAAQSLVDKHVVKMILESAQLLSTAHRVLDGIEMLDTTSGRKIKRFYLNDEREHIVYKSTHVNHPSARWIRESVENYLWLVEHFYALMSEYTHRYGKKHKCFDIAYYIQSPPKNLNDYSMTTIPCAMDKKYIVSNDPIENYRNYYRVGKQHLHTWTKRDKPEWI